MSEETRDTEPVVGALSCPFCGSDGEERTYVGDVGAERLVRHQIRCRGCGAATRWFASGRDALQAWASRRHPPLDREALRDRIAEIFQAYDELGYTLVWDDLDDEAHRRFRNAADRILDLSEGADDEE